MKIAFQATFSKLTSLIDGGLRLSFDLPEDTIKEVSEVLSMKNESLMVVVMPESEFKQIENQIEEVND